MRLTVLGCDGSWPGPGGACSSYLLEDASTSIWIDAGFGGYANLYRYREPSSLDAVVITHRHLDHCIDLAAMFGSLKYGESPSRRILVLAAAEVREELFRRGEPIDEIFDWRVIDEDQSFTIGSMTLSFSRTDHEPPTFAVLATVNDVTFAYSSDTGPCWSFDAFGKHIDVALCEAAFEPEQERGNSHLSARQAGMMSKAAGVGRLLLTHIRPNGDRDRARRDAMLTFGPNVELVERDKAYDIPPNN